MKPKRVPTSNVVFQLPGGTEDNDLWAERTKWDNDDVIISVWQLLEAERKMVAEGGTIELIVWGKNTPPIALSVGPSIQERKNEI